MNCNTQYNHRKDKSNQQTTIRSIHMWYVCALHCAQLQHTILHRTDLIIFPLTLQTTAIVPMMCIWEKGGRSQDNFLPMIFTFKHGLNSAKVKQQAKYLPQRSFSSSHSVQKLSSGYTKTGMQTHAHIGWLVGWSLMSLFSTNTAISETKGQGWRVTLLPSEERLAIY